MGEYQVGICRWDGDCNHENKRHLLLGRKAVTNLDSILKIRDITWPTQVLTVKAMVFTVIMYGCEIIKKAKNQRTDASNCGAGEDSWTVRKSTSRS